MTDHTRARRWRRMSLALGTSGLACGVVLASAARAQCAPDPTVPNGTSTCTGTDANGIRVTTNGTTLVVASGARVTNTGAPAIAVDVPASAQPFYTYRSATLAIGGVVDGGGQAGIAVLSGSVGTGAYDYYGTRAAITVQAGARITGTSGITVGASTGNSYGPAVATLDNAGSITGASGNALLSASPALAGFVSIINRAGGMIGAIGAPVGVLTNAGTIDGGANSAIATGTTYNSAVGAGAWSNSGTIQSSGTATTVAGSFTLFTNTGLVTNTGTGLALTGNPIVNSGRIATAGTTAISGLYVSLVNTGRIDGGVTATASMTGQVGSTIDSSAGVINGNVTLGAGNDVLVARYNGTATPVTGITGAIDGGAGTDTLRLVFDANTTVATAIRLPTNFEQLGLAPAAGTTATLGTGFINNGTIVLAGSGTVVNAGTLANGGTVVAVDGQSVSYPSFVNQGTIRGTGTTSGQYAVSLGFGGNAFANTGTIAAVTDAVLANGSSFANAGTITAGGTAVSSSSTTFANTGTIRSTGGTALVLNGSSGAGYVHTNSGTINGASAGVNLSTSLVNTGTITSAGTGVALQSYGQMDNRAGATIAGTTIAISPGTSGSLFNATVLNAGTINGDVNLNGGTAGTYNANRFFALAGGVLNGDLTLSAGSFFITQLVNTGSGQFAGVNGTVRGNGAGLVYQAGSDASAAFAPPGGFASIGYELFNAAKITLTGSGTSAVPVTVAGIGSVDLTANLTATTAPAISTTSLQTASGYSSAANALSIISRGTLTLTRTDANAYPGAAVYNGPTTSFTNAGTIVVRDQASTYNRIAGIDYGTVVNSGTISVGGATGVFGAATLTNSGSITQLAGAVAGIGVENVDMLVNTGTISVGGVAVDATPYFYDAVTITNAAGGTIASGSGTAIRLSRATLTNAGTITGTVDLGYAAPSYAGASTRSGYSSAYVAAGGTIAGDLLFGTGSDLFLQTGDTTGVSGVVDGGTGFGTDIYGRVLSSTGSAAIDFAGVRNFEDALIQARGTDTVATATATGTFAGNLYALGNGSVVNTAAIAGSLTTTAPYAFAALFPADQNMLGSLTNAGTIGGTVTATVPVFVNSGTIGSGTSAGAAVTITDTTPLSFTNTGRIASAPSGTPAYYSYFSPQTVVLTGATSVAIANSGQITGAGLGATTLLTSGQAGSLTLTNSGSITATGSRTAAYLLLSSVAPDASGAIAVTNSGTIAAQGSTSNGNDGSASALYLGLPGSTAPTTFAVTNSGTISAASVAAANGARTGSSALRIGSAGASGTITNAAGGLITASGSGDAYAITALGASLTLTNAGTISAMGSTSSTALYVSAITTLRNTGSIAGDVRLSAGADTVDNAGTITGSVVLGAGDDLFVQRVGGTVSGLVDGGDGNDSYLVDTTGGATTLAASGIANFERVTQTGTGTGTYSGSFGVDTITLAGGTLAVAAGQTLATTGATTVTGLAGSGSLVIVNNGTIVGGIALADGNDTVVNNGTIGGAVQLGTGNDTYVEGVGSVAQGGVDGGGGTNLYRVVLAGNRTGIGARTNFQNLALDGTGTLGLTLDQSYQTIALNGASLTLTMGNYAVGQIVATSSAAAQLSFDGAVGGVTLGAGNDTVTLLTSAQVSGAIDGGAGTDTLVLDGSGAGALGSAQILNIENGIKQGSGSWTLTGTAAASPTNWTIAAGTLTVAGGNAIADTASVAVASGATLALQAGETIDALAGAGTVALGASTLTVGGGNGSGIFAGTIGGTGGLTKVGSGRETLSSANTYTGATTIVAGTLALGSANAIAAASPVTIAGGATFDLASYNQAVGSLAGAGTVALGAGTLTAGGGNVDSTFAGAIGGTGGLIKTGTGALNLTGASSYTGATTITAGRLAVNGSLTSTVLVNAGGTLGGNGAVAGLTIASGGIVAPGNSIGTIAIAGNVTFNAGSTYQVEANAAGMADRINAGGTVTLNGGTVQVLAAPGTYNPLTNYTIVTAAGGVTGRFAGATSSLAFLTPYLSYGATAVTLSLGRNDISFASQATSPNGVAVANAIAARGLGDTIYNAILVQTAYGAGTAFNQLSGEIHATIPMVAIDSDRRVRDAILDRVRTAQDEGLGVWLQSMDTRAHARDQGGRADFHTDRFGLYGGADYAIAGFRVGLSGGWFDDKLRDPNVYSRAEIGTALIGGSIGYTALDGRLLLDAGATHGWHRASTTRVVTTTGLTGTYLSHSTLQTTQLFGEAAYRLPVGPIALTPFVAIDRDWSRADAFLESGGVAALGVAGDRRHVTTGSAGARVAASLPVGTGWVVEPHLSLAYLRNWGRLGAQRTETFGGSGPAFTVTGDRLGRDNVDASGGLDLLAGSNIRLDISGYTTRSSQWRDYGGKASVGIRF